MSYEKPQAANLNLYHARTPSQASSSLSEYKALVARRPSQDRKYLQYGRPGAADLQSQQFLTAYDRQSDHMNHGPSAIYQPRATFEATPSIYQGFELVKLLQVSYSPGRGSKGTLVDVYLDSSDDLVSPTPPIATLMFATRSVPAALTLNRLEPRGQDVCYKYSISATAPAFSETGASHLRVPLRLQIQGQSELDGGQIYIGDWVYEDGTHLAHRSSPKVSRKRKGTDELSDTPRPKKRVTPSEQQPTQSQAHGSYSYPSASLAYPPSLDFSTMQRRYTPYGRSQLQQSLQHESKTTNWQSPIDGTSTAHTLMRPPGGQTSSWSSSYGTEYQSGRDPQTNAVRSFQVSSIISPSPANPTLIRSSLIQQPSPSTASASSSSPGNFNPYALYPNRAVLQMSGNLDAMQGNWTQEERALKRRIVRFWREQNGTTINAYHKPVSADEPALPHERNERRISCIYWEERDAYYVTSVDTISLLESLIGIRFGTEEKNRIRRNLEGFKPCTVCKGKAESDSFFKLIMGFPNPRPRIIEKDVKAFKWDILEQALKKIVSKYSANPSSTAGTLEQQTSPNFGETQSEAGAGRHSALSEYMQQLKSSTLSPPAIAHGLPSSSQASPLQQYSAPSLAHSYSVSTLDSPYIPNTTFNSPYTAQVSIPSLSSTYTASTIGRRRSNNAPTEDVSAWAAPYPGRPQTGTSFANPYAPQEWAEARATLGLPGRASTDLSFNTDFTSSTGIGDAQYRRCSDLNNATEGMQFKEE